MSRYQDVPQSGGYEQPYGNSYGNAGGSYNNGPATSGGGAGYGAGGGNGYGGYSDEPSYAKDNSCESATVIISCRRHIPQADC